VKYAGVLVFGILLLIERSPLDTLAPAWAQWHSGIVAPQHIGDMV
jgi:hypothetical protein